MNGHSREVIEYLREQWLSNCCNAPRGQTPQETDYCGECGEHCEFEMEGSNEDDF